MLKKLLNISCKKATYFATKKEAEKISFLDNLKLESHYKICDACRLFDQQTSVIARNARSIHKYTNAKISEQKKKEIIELLKNA